MAAFVGFSRINDNAHYLHDVLAGATIGATYGIGVFIAHKNRIEKKSTSSVFLILPLHSGIITNYSINF